MNFAAWFNTAPGNVLGARYAQMHLVYSGVARNAEREVRPAALGREALVALISILELEGTAAPTRKTLRTWLEIHESTGSAPRERN